MSIRVFDPFYLQMSIIPFLVFSKQDTDLQSWRGFQNQVVTLVLRFGLIVASLTMIKELTYLDSFAIGESTIWILNIENVISHSGEEYPLLASA